MHWYGMSYGCYRTSHNNYDRTIKNNLPSGSPADYAFGTFANLCKTPQNQKRSQKQAQLSTRGSKNMSCLLVPPSPPALQTIITVAWRMVQSLIIMLHIVPLVSLNCFSWPVFVLTLFFLSNQSHLFWLNTIGGNLDKVHTLLTSSLFLAQWTPILPETPDALNEYDIF